MIGAVTANGRGAPIDGLFASATLEVSALVRNFGPGQMSASTKFLIVDASGAVVASTTTDAGTVNPNGLTAVNATIQMTKAELWSIGRPYLYTISAILESGDAVNVTVGVRSTHFDADTGFYLNGQHTKMRGFCDHNDFGVSHTPQSTSATYRALA